MKRIINSCSNTCLQVQIFYKYGLYVNSGIYRDNTMADKFMYIPNDNAQNYPFCRLKLVVEKFEHLT